MAKKDAKVVEMPKAEQPKDNKPSYDNLVQIANQLVQQNEFLKKRNAVLENELAKFSNNYQRTVFLQETLRIDSSYQFVDKGFFKVNVINASPFDEDLIKSYADELVGLLNENKGFKDEAKELLKKENNEQSASAEKAE